jgi:hypothetical protein
MSELEFNDVLAERNGQKNNLTREKAHCREPGGGESTMTAGTNGRH